MTAQPANSGSSESPLDRAAAQGPLPGIAAEDAMEERGEDDSSTADQEVREERIARGDLPGGIAMHS